VRLPRSALRNNNQVLVIDPDNKIRFRNVRPLRLYKDDVLIEAGLQAGERVCLSTIQTAINGMDVNPVDINLLSNSQG
jgi:multidrug efflux pump subunit AcrA (membrane-fusion protein)